MDRCDNRELTVDADVVTVPVPPDNELVVPQDTNVIRVLREERRIPVER